MTAHTSLPTPPGGPSSACRPEPPAQVGRPTTRRAAAVRQVGPAGPGAACPAPARPGRRAGRLRPGRCPTSAVLAGLARSLRAQESARRIARSPSRHPGRRPRHGAPARGRRGPGTAPGGEPRRGPAVHPGRAPLPRHGAGPLDAGPLVDAAARRRGGRRVVVDPRAGVPAGLLAAAVLCWSPRGAGRGRRRLDAATGRRRGGARRARGGVPGPVCRAWRPPFSTPVRRRRPVSACLPGPFTSTTRRLPAVCATWRSGTTPQPPGSRPPRACPLGSSGSTAP